MAFRAPVALFRETLLNPLLEALRVDRDAIRPVASGRRVERASDDPLDFVRSRGLEAELRSSKQFVKNAVDATRLLDGADFRIAEITDRLQRARTLVHQASNDTLTTADRALLATEINLILDDMIEIANARADGQALFGGAETADDPFRVVRDSSGEATEVIYRGDRVESVRKIGVGETDTEVVTFVGSQIFQVEPDRIVSGRTFASATDPLRNGVGVELDALQPTSVAIEVNGRRITLDLATDSLNAVAQKLNDSISGVTARVPQVLVGTGTVATATTPIGATAGSFLLNGVLFGVSAGETPTSLAAKLNRETHTTGVTATVVSSGPGFTLRLDGPTTIDDTGAGASDVWRAGRLGITTGGPPPGNIIAGAVQFALELETDVPDQLFLRDLGDGRFLQRMEITDGVEPPTGNEHARAVVDDASIFRVLMEIRSDLRAGEGERILRKHLESLRVALDSNVQVQAQVGARRKRVEDAQRREEEFQVVFEKFLSEARDVDFAEATTNLAQARTKLAAAAEASKGVAPVTLANFI